MQQPTGRCIVMHAVAGPSKRPDIRADRLRKVRGVNGAVVAYEADSKDDSFAVRLSLALRSANLSGAQLSAAVGVDKSVVSRWLSGHVQPTSYNLARISAAIAKVNPGFNMLLWTAPRAEFEAAIGVKPPTDPSMLPTESDSEAVARSPILWWATRAVAGAIVLALLVAMAIWAASSFRQPSRPVTTGSRSVQPSIAVMPFVNMTGDPAEEYLGDGMSEEILNDLANIPALRVAARTSSFAFKGKQAPIDEIARKLKVQSVLEGSVRRQGERIRVVAQLINAANGYHIWSARYDRRLDDILSMQDEIARAIAGALDRKLIPGRTARAIAPKAYQDYLQAQYFFNLRTPDGLSRADQLLEDAIALQPDFAAAYALRGHLLYLLPPNFLAESQRMAAEALRLDPGNREALYTDLMTSFRGFDLARLYRDAHRFLGMRNPDAVAYNAVHFFYAFMGFPNESLRAARQAAESDPLNFSYRVNYAAGLQSLGRTREALAADEAVLELSPSHPRALFGLCVDSARAGQIGRARAYGRQLAAQHNQTPGYGLLSGSTGDWEWMGKSCESEIALQLGQRAQVHRLLDAVPRRDLLLPNLARLYARAGDLDQAIDLFSRVYERKNYFLTFVDVQYDAATPKALLQDARWKALWRRPLLQDWQRYHDRLAAELARPHAAAR